MLAFAVDDGITNDPSVSMYAPPSNFQSEKSEYIALLVFVSIVGAVVSYLIVIGSDTSDMLSLLSTVLKYTVISLPFVTDQFSLPEYVVPFCLTPLLLSRFSLVHPVVPFEEYCISFTPDPSSIVVISVYTCLFVHVPEVYAELSAEYFATIVGLLGAVLSSHIAYKVTVAPFFELNLLTACPSV